MKQGQFELADGGTIFHVRIIRFPTDFPVTRPY
ncbi:MAG: hypothetical protein P8X42_10645 [Calditrichaceae bacterium]